MISKITKLNIKEFSFFFIVQCWQFFMLTINFRAVAQANYLFTGISDFVISTANFFLIKKIAEAKSKSALIGYALGGSCGSLIAIYVTKIIYGR